MKKYLLAAVAVSAIAIPAMPAAARDGQGYAGIEAGVLWAKSQDLDGVVVFTSVDNPIIVGGTPALPPPPVGGTFGNAFNVDSKMGYNIGIYGGYDFGMFRLEGDIDWMHANLDKLDVDTPLIDALDDLD